MSPTPGEIVPVEIAIWPVGMRWRRGEQLQLAIAGYMLTPTPLPRIASPSLIAVNIASTQVENTDLLN